MFNLRAPRADHYETPFGYVFILDADKPAVIWVEELAQYLRENHGFVEWVEETPEEVKTPAPRKTK
jgi:hypothetical protein